MCKGDRPAFFLQDWDETWSKWSICLFLISHTQFCIHSNRSLLQAVCKVLMLQMAKHCNMPKSQGKEGWSVEIDTRGIERENRNRERLTWSGREKKRQKGSGMTREEQRGTGDGGKRSDQVCAGMCRTPAGRTDLLAWVWAALGGALSWTFRRAACE